MGRLIDYLQEELSILNAVFNFRIRSFVLFVASLLIPVGMQLVALAAIRESSIPALENGIHQAIGLFSLVLMLKLLAVSFSTYLKDRAALLRL